MCSLNEAGLKVLKSWRAGVDPENYNAEMLMLMHIFNGTDSPMYVARMDTYELLYANRALKELVGEDIIGKKCHDVLQGNDFPCDFCTNDQIKNIGDIYTWEFLNKRGRWYKCIDEAVLWVDNTVVRLEIAIDITDIKTKELELKEAIKIITRDYVG